MNKMKMIIGLVAVLLVVGFLSLSPPSANQLTSGTKPESAQNTPTAADGTSVAHVGSQQPYRTFITVQKYTIEQTGDPNSSVSNVRLDLTFPNGSTVQLPENGQHWVIGNGQVQEIDRTFELPFALIRNDGFRFRIQMIRRGSKMLPCEFDVAQLSQFDRAYVCHTDLNWQSSQNIAAESQDREGLQIRVFTDRHSPLKENQKNVIAIR